MDNDPQNRLVPLQRQDTERLRLINVYAQAMACGVPLPIRFAILMRLAEVRAGR